MTVKNQRKGEQLGAFSVQTIGEVNVIYVCGKITNSRTQQNGVRVLKIASGMQNKIDAKIFKNNALESPEKRDTKKMVSRLLCQQGKVQRKRM